MANISMGELISTLRKEKGMTQKELAEKMKVTDKAVSKWERNISCPDINSLPDLANILGVSVDELLSTTKKENENPSEKDKIIDIILMAIPLAMSVCVFVTSIFETLSVSNGMCLLALGLFCLALGSFRKNKEK